jgi:hypothetical protein
MVPGDECGRESLRIARWLEVGGSSKLEELGANQSGGDVKAETTSPREEATSVHHCRCTTAWSQSRSEEATVVMSRAENIELSN